MTGGSRYIDWLALYLAAFILLALWGHRRYGVPAALRVIRQLRAQWDQKTELGSGRRLLVGTLHLPTPLITKARERVLFYQTNLWALDQPDSETFESADCSREVQTTPCVLQTSTGDIPLPLDALGKVGKGSFQHTHYQLTYREFRQLVPTLADTYPPTEGRSYEFTESFIPQDRRVYVIGDFTRAPVAGPPTPPPTGGPAVLPWRVQIARIDDRDPGDNLEWDRNYLILGIGSTLLLSTYAGVLLLKLLR